MEPPTQQRQQCSAPRLPIECVWDHSTRTTYQTLTNLTHVFDADSTAVSKSICLVVDGDGDGLIAESSGGGRLRPRVHTAAPGGPSGGGGVPIDLIDDGPNHRQQRDAVLGDDGQQRMFVPC